jgi:glycosyltransferase involved in cell wall biosynthesis
VDLNIFQPASPAIRNAARGQLGIPKDAVCIGSFQKDGVGWNAGLEPKLIKGPDIFLRSVERLAGQHRVFVLLTGPARGYVKNGLDQLGIPYHHMYLSNYQEIAAYYQCLDLYLVTSRDEGGPKALLESMATGVPVVSTKVGMAPDIMTNGQNGFLADVEDVEGIVGLAEMLVTDQELQERCIEGGLTTAAQHDWNHIALRYYHEVYAPLLTPRVGH